MADPVVVTVKCTASHFVRTPPTAAKCPLCAHDKAAEPGPISAVLIGRDALVYAVGAAHIRELETGNRYRVIVATGDPAIERADFQEAQVDMAVALAAVRIFDAALPATEAGT